MSVCLLVGRPSLPVCHNFIRQVKSEQLFILFCMYFWGKLHWWRSDMFFALLYVVFLGVPFKGTFLCMIQRSLYALISKVLCHMSYVTGWIFFLLQGALYICISCYSCVLWVHLIFESSIKRYIFLHWFQRSYIGQCFCRSCLGIWIKTPSE